MALRKITIRVDDNDLDALREAYPKRGYNWVIRALVRRHVRQLQARTAEILEQGSQDDPTVADGGASHSLS